MAKNKLGLSLIALAVFGFLVFSSSANAAVAAPASKKSVTTASKPVAKVKVQGLAKFVLAGTVVSQSNGSLTVHITSSSKNAALFKNKDVPISTDSKTKITKNGKVVALSTLTPGAKVKIFGIFNKKAGTIKQTRWIKVSK